MDGLDVYRNITEKLKLLRTLEGLSQQHVADRLHISRSTYSYYELGESKPPLDALCALAEYFEVNIGYLIGTEEIRLGHKFYKSWRSTRVARLNSA